jgi:hypothetical protein
MRVVIATSLAMLNWEKDVSPELLQSRRLENFPFCRHWSADIVQQVHFFGQCSKPVYITQ